MRGGRHPLFIRIEQREAIFNQTDKSCLTVSADSSNAQKFVEIFSLDPEKQLSAFIENAETFSELFCSLTSDAAISLLMALFDRVIDLDYVNVMNALVPYADNIANAAGRSLKVRETDVKTFAFRTLVLLLGSVISEASVEATLEKAEMFMSVVEPVLSQNNITEHQAILEGLKRFFRVDMYREVFIKKDGVNKLIKMIANTQKLSHTDTLYHILFCVWQLTYSIEGAGKLSENEFVEVLGKLLASVQPEKEEIVRLLTAIIGQLQNSIVFIENAFDNDILRLFRAFQAKRYVDPELGKEVSTTADNLYQALKKISLWEKYVREVNGPVLRFSLSHKSEFFWKNNIERFGENNYEMLDKLKQHLASDDPTTVAVACHDIGEFASRSPIQIPMEIKESVMLLLTHQSAEVQKWALRTTQLLLLRNQS